ncbi:mCG147811 [Mus musculus]|nr:mCG147811 [Mus musculus]
MGWQLSSQPWLQQHPSGVIPPLRIMLSLSITQWEWFEAVQEHTWVDSASRDLVPVMMFLLWHGGTEVGVTPLVKPQISPSRYPTASFHPTATKTILSSLLCNRA